MDFAYTAMLSVSKAEPPVLVAVTVYFFVGDESVGVPVMTPVVRLNVNPAGSAGEIEYEATAPPCDDGKFEGIAVPTT